MGGGRKEEEKEKKRKDTKELTIKENGDKLGFYKIKNFCWSKDTIKKMKREVTNWKNIPNIFIYLTKDLYPTDWNEENVLRTVQVNNEKVKIPREKK